MQTTSTSLICSLQSFIYKQMRRHIHKCEWDKELERIPDILDDRFQIPKVPIWTLNGKNEARGQASSSGGGLGKWYMQWTLWGKGSQDTFVLHASHAVSCLLTSSYPYWEQAHPHTFLLAFSQACWKYHTLFSVSLKYNSIFSYRQVCTKEVDFAQREILAFSLEFWKVVNIILDRSVFV